MTHTYHPNLPDEEALTRVRAAIEVRSTIIRVVADMQRSAGAPRYGPLTSPPLLKLRPHTVSGLALHLEGLPMSIASEWGDIQIAASCSEATPQQSREVLRRLAERGMVIELDGDPETEFLLTGNVLSVGGRSLPPVRRASNGTFRTLSEASRAFRAACDDITRR